MYALKSNVCKRKKKRNYLGHSTPKAGFLSKSTITQKRGSKRFREKTVFLRSLFKGGLVVTKKQPQPHEATTIHAYSSSVFKGELIFRFS
jgi:hypothetical protein